MLVYFVRHGQSVSNQKGICIPETEDDLTSIGKIEVKTTHKKLKKYKFDHVIVSSYSRAKQTCLFKKFVVWDNLIERARPKECIGLEYKSLKYRKHRDAFDLLHFDEFKNRGLIVMDKIRNLSGENVLIYSHEGFIKLILSFCIFGPDLSFDQYNLIYNNSRNLNCGISIFKADVQKRWKLLTWSDTSHLV